MDFIRRHILFKLLITYTLLIYYYSTYTIAVVIVDEISWLLIKSRQYRFRRQIQSNTADYCVFISWDSERFSR